MANIENAFEVDDGISLKGDVLITTGNFDPMTGAGEAAPVGSLFLRSDVGFVYLKNDVLDTDWIQLEGSMLPGNLLGNAASTGILTGGTITANANNTTLDITAGIGIIVDNHTNVLNPTATLVSWPNFTAVPITNLATSTRSAIAINSSGVIVQSPVPFTNAEHKNYITLGNIGHANFTNILSVRNNPDTAFDASARLADLARAIGAFNISGNNYSANGATLQLAKSSGRTYRLGSNFQVTKKDTDTTIDSAEIPVNFLYSWQNGSGGFSVGTTSTDVDPAKWDDGSGILQNVPGGKWTVQIIKYFSGIVGSLKTRIEYGQRLYANMNAALEAVPDPDHYHNPAFEEGVIRGFLILASHATNLTVPTDAEIVTAGKFAGSTSGGTGVSPVSLQLAYENSVVPEIVTNTVLGALAIKEGAGVGGNLFEGYDENNVQVFSVSADGNITLTGTIDGRNISADGLILDNHVANLLNPHATTLALLGDALISSPLANQVLTWNGTKWVNAAASGSQLKLYSERPIGTPVQTATGTNSIAIGNNSVASRYGQFAQASGRFAADGDAQTSTLTARLVTVGAGINELFLDGAGATQRLTIPDNTVWGINVMVVGRNIVNTESAVFSFTGSLKRGVGAATQVYSGSKSIVTRDVAQWNASLNSDTVNGSLKMEVEGVPATTIRWSARIELTEVSV